MRRPLQAHEKWMIDQRENVLLVSNVLDLLGLDDSSDGHDLQGIVGVRITMADKLHSTEGSYDDAVSHSCGCSSP